MSIGLYWFVVFSFGGEVPGDFGELATFSRGSLTPAVLISHLDFQCG